MADTPFPLPRATRQTDVLEGDGTTTVFGPFSFKIFDIEDVEVQTRLDGATFFSVAAATVAKTSADAFSDFTVTFAAAPAATTEFLVIGRREPMRQLAVTKGGSIAGAELEKELSKQAVALSEYRRDLDRAYVADAGGEGKKIAALPEGHFPMADADGNLVDGGSAEDISGAQAYAAAAAGSAASAAEDADRAEAAANSISIVQVEKPADIAALTVDLAKPAINVLGYPTSPGARHDWVRVASEPTHALKEQSLDGQWWTLSPFVMNVEHHGAWVRGSNVSATLQNAVDVALSFNGGASLVMPAGDVYLETSVTGALGGVSRFLSLRGQGYEATRILLDGVSGAGGIHFEHPTLDGTASVGHFRDFGIVMDGQGVYGTPALRWKRPEGGQSHGRTFVLENVRIGNLAIATDYVGAGVDVSGAHHPLFKNYQLTGPWGPGVPGGDYSNTSIIYASEYGINMDGSYQGEILDSQIWGCRFGIYNRSAEPTGGEGLHLSRTNIVQVRRGLWWERTGPEPSIWIDKCHINYRDIGLYVDGCRLGDITNSLIYQEDSSGAAASAPIDVYLRNVLEMQLTDNRHHFAGDTRRICYQVDTADTYESNIEIIRPRLGSGSSFTNLAYIGAGAVDVQIVDPNIPSGVMSGVLLGGTGTASIRYTYPKPTQVRRATSVQSIPDGLANAAAVSWNSEIDDPRGLYDAGSPTRITVPSRAGITKLRISTNIQWASNSVGVRQVFLKKNGAAFELGFSIQVPAGVGTNAQFVQSGWLTVADGYYFEVFVGQTSGGPLDIVNSNNTWCSVETA